MEHRILERYPLGNSKRAWRQDNFILSTFQGKGTNMRDALENCVDAGLNLIELGWATHEQANEAVQLCEELGVDLIFQDFTIFGGMQERNVDRKITEQVAHDIVNRLRPWKRVIGYYVWDEPYHDEDLAEARRQIDLLLHENPSAIAFACAIPSYNSLYTWKNGEFPAYLRRFADTIEPPALSLDYYPIGNGKTYTEEGQLDNSLFWCDLEMMRKVCREKKMPLWFYYQAFDRFSTEHYIFPMTRMMMHSAILYGAKGLQNFTAPSSITYSDGRKGRYFEEIKEINAGIKKLGNTLMALDSKFVFHSSDLLPGCTYEEGLTDALKNSKVIADKELPNRVSVGELEDEYGNLYLFILNRDYHKAQTFEINLKETSRIYEVSKKDGRQYLQDEAGCKKMKFSLDAGDAVLYRIQSTKDEAFTLEYRISKVRHELSV